MAKKPTSPLKITLHLLDGRLNSADGIIMFDGILYHAWFCKYAPEVLIGLGRQDFDGYTGLPLRQLPDNRWAASRGIYEECGQNVEHINKRPDFFQPDKIGRLNLEKGLISDKVGEYRAYRMPAIIRTIKDGMITFWAMGHKSEVEDLLALMLAAGKKTAMGYGLVDYWQVEDCDQDYSLWHPDYGLMRPVDVESEATLQYDLSRYPIMQYAVKPPYWKSKNLRLCYVPIG